MHTRSMILGLIVPLALFFSQAVSAQTETPTGTGILDLGITPDAVLCGTGTAYQLEGESDVKIGTSQEYRISGLPTEPLLSPAIDFSLLRDGEILEQGVNKDKYLRLFSSPWEATIEAVITDQNGCVTTLRKDIRIYSTLVSYIGSDFSWLDDGVVELLDKRSVLFKKVELSSEGGLLDANSSVSDVLYKEWAFLRESDLIVIDMNDSIPVLTALEKVRSNSADTVSFAQKQLYIVSDIRTSLLGKLLASPLKLLGASDVGVLRSGTILDFLLRINTGLEKPEDTETISYSQASRFYSLGGIVEYISYEGFPISFLGLLLSISVVVLILNFLKQIVGVYVFGIYNPVLLALSLTVADVRIAITLLLIGFLSVIITNFCAKKFYLLYNAKRSFLVGVYVLLSIVFIGAAHAAGLGSFVNVTFTNAFVIFPIFFMVVVADKIFHEDIDVFSRGGVLMFLQFAAISIMAFWVMNSVNIRYFLLSYPDILFLIAALNLAIGRYTGLQFFEYVRFLPLIGTLREEE